MRWRACLSDQLGRHVLRAAPRYCPSTRWARCTHLPQCIIWARRRIAYEELFRASLFSQNYTVNDAEIYRRPASREPKDLQPARSPQVHPQQKCAGSRGRWALATCTNGKIKSNRTNTVL